MKERLYLVTDRQLEERALERIAEERFFESLHTKAFDEKNRVVAKAKTVKEVIVEKHKEFLENVPQKNRDAAFFALTDLEKKRERSRSGLVGALVRQGVIQKEHVHAQDGSLDIAALSKTSYFQENSHLLDVLSTYHLSQKSKVRQEAAKAPKRNEESVREVEVKATDLKPENVLELETTMPQVIVQSEAPVETKTVLPTKRRRLRAAAAAATVLALLSGGARITMLPDASAENMPLRASSMVKVQEDDEDSDDSYKEGDGSEEEKVDDKNKKDTKKHGKLKEARKEIRAQRYTVKKGDTLWELAEWKYGNAYKWHKIKQANCHSIDSPQTLQVGQEINIPKRQKGRFSLTYIVKPDDTLYDIAKRKCSRVKPIVKTNHEIKDPDLIYPNQVFHLPVKSQPDSGGPSSYQAKPDKRHQSDKISENSSSGFISPLSSCTVTSEFGMRYHPILGYNKLHTGLDMGAVEGTSVGSIGSGTVEFAGWQSGYGNTVIVDHPGAVDSMYAHLSGFDTYQGEHVSAGEQIGQVGTTGFSTGPHLHLEMRINGVPKNPRNWFANPCGDTSREKAQSSSYKHFGKGGRDYSPEGVVRLIRKHWPDEYENQAIAVAKCESTLGANEYNEQHTALGQHPEGIFQFIRSTWNSTSFGNESPYNDEANVQAAYELFHRNGNSWKEWACKP